MLKMTTKATLTGVSNITGISQKTGKPYSFWKAHLSTSVAGGAGVQTVEYDLHDNAVPTLPKTYPANVEISLELPSKYPAKIVAVRLAA